MGINKNFVIRNGLEVDAGLIFADADANKVGIATTTLTSTLTVNGDVSGIEASFSGIITATQFDGNLQSSSVNTTNLNVSGVSTVSSIKIDGLITAGSSEGVSGQYLKHTGVGVTWESISQLRTVDVQTASEGQSIFNTDYTVGLLDVYLNGVKLSSSEFTATNGTSVTLADSAFGDDTLEFISFSPLQSGVLPVNIEVSGNQLTFSVSGVGSTVLILS